MPKHQYRLEQLIQSRHPCISIVTDEEDYVRSLISQAVLGSVDPYWVWTSVRGVFAGLLENPEGIKDTEHPAAALHYLWQNLSHSRAVCVMYDIAGHLDDARTTRALRELMSRFRSNGSTLVLVDHGDSLPAVIKSHATELEIPLPDTEELERIVRATLQSVHRESRIAVKLNKEGLNTVIRNLRGLNRRQAARIIEDTVLLDRVFDKDDVQHVLADKRRRFDQTGVLQYIETPEDLSSIGGLRKLKTWLDDRRSALEPEAAEYGLPAPRGVLLLGVQGAGKSLCAKAVATAWQRPLLRLDPGTLYDRYVGESERRLRSALHQAEMMAPIVLWIDEIEKGFASAAAHSTDGGLSQRMFGTLLTWMQDHRAPVFLVATANNIEALPPELLRKGRFDEIFFVDLPDRSVRKDIFAIHLRKRKRDADLFDLDALADVAAGYSGAEIEQAIIAAMHRAYSAGEVLTTQHVATAVTASPPLSVTMREKIEQLRTWATDRCVPAD